MVETQVISGMLHPLGAKDEPPVKRFDRPLLRKDFPMKPRVFSFHYALRDTTGAEIDSSAGGDPLSFIEGSGQIIPGLERALLLLSVGDKREIPVPSKDAYGTRDDKRVFQVEKSKIPNQKVAVGDMFRGDEDMPVLTVVTVTDSHVTLDGNHPLAGKDLIFKIEITSIREATKQEMDHGHVHGAHGHDH